MLKCKFDILANTTGIDEGSERFTTLAFPFIFPPIFFFSYPVFSRGWGLAAGDDVMLRVLRATPAALSSVPARAEGGQAGSAPDGQCVMLLAIVSQCSHTASSSHYMI